MIEAIPKTSQRCKSKRRNNAKPKNNTRNVCPSKETKHVRIASGFVAEKKTKKKHFVRPCSPAAYPSPLPICDDFFDDSSSLSSHDEYHKEQPTEEIKKKEVTVKPHCQSEASFWAFRVHYLIIHIAIMLADGLQGTHLYILYESYGYTVASLYCLGFVSGAITSPFIGPLVDRIGRRRSAIAYCVLEIIINMLEQYDLLAGLIVSRVVGGITTNLLFTVFESWLVTEHRLRGFSEEKLEIVLRDSVVASNLSAIASGCLSHVLALYLGSKGPFEGAVVCTFVALLLIMTRWEENYGSEIPGVKTVSNYMNKAFKVIISDSKVYRIGLIQGLTEGALQTFVFLWSPALRHLASKVYKSNGPTGFKCIGMDSNGEPTYGLIFGVFMFCGAVGGYSEPFVRKLVQKTIEKPINEVVDYSGLSPTVDSSFQDGVLVTTNAAGGSDSFQTDISDLTGYDNDYENDDEDPLAAEFLTTGCYLISAALLAVPTCIDQESPYVFTASLTAFLIYEFIVGLYLPCEGILRTYFMPNDCICSLMTMLRVIVNVAVALGVISTNYIPFTTAFAACSGALIIAAALQLSLIDRSILISLFYKKQEFTYNDKEPPNATTISSLSSSSTENINSNNIGLRQRKKKLTQ